MTGKCFCSSKLGFTSGPKRGHFLRDDRTKMWLRRLQLWVKGGKFWRFSCSLRSRNSLECVNVLMRECVSGWITDGSFILIGKFWELAFRNFSSKINPLFSNKAIIIMIVICRKRFTRSTRFLPERQGENVNVGVWECVNAWVGGYHRDDCHLLEKIYKIY